MASGWRWPSPHFNLSALFFHISAPIRHGPTAQSSQTMPEEAKLADDLAHRLTDMMNDGYAQSTQSAKTPPGEEDDYDELMQRTPAAEARIRQIAKQFLTQEQVDTVIAPPAK